MTNGNSYTVKSSEAPKQAPTIDAPFSEQAEAQVLGSILLDPEQYVHVAAVLEPTDFFLLRNNYIFAAMGELYAANDPVDLIAISDKLDTKGKLEAVGGMSHLINLSNQVGTSTHATYYAQLVKRTAWRRRLLALSDVVRTLALDEEMNTNDIAADIMQQAYAATQSPDAHDVVSMHEVQSRTYDKVLERVEIFRRTKNENYILGIPTGLRDFDTMIDGLQPGDVNTFASVTGMGKTSLTLTIALNAAQAGYNVTMFSGEMTEEALGMRLQSMLSGVNATKIRKGTMNGKELGLWTQAVGRLSELPIQLKPGSSLHTSDMRSMVTKLKHTRGMDLLILDGILQLEGKKEDQKRLEIANVMRACESVAIDFEIPVVLTHQISRQVDKRENKRPTLGDLAEAADIERTSARVVMLYRDSYYNDQANNPELAELIVRKNRHGEAGTVLVRHNMAFTKFEDTTVTNIYLNED